MKTPNTVLTQLAVTYREQWRTWLTEPPATTLIVPLSPPDGQQITDNPEQVSYWVSTWLTWVQQHPGTALEEKNARTPFGAQARPVRLILDGPATVATLIGRGEHWATAVHRWAQLVRDWPQATPTLNPLLNRIVELADYDFTVLLEAATWLVQHPVSGLMPRQVPVAGMHSKWLRHHHRLVTALVLPALETTPADPKPHEAAPDDVPEDDVPEDEATEDEATEDESTEDESTFTTELTTLGLRARPHAIGIILADPADRQRMHGLRHLAAPTVELAALPLAPRYVLVVENKESALIIDDHPGLVVIHSLGRHVDALAALPWAQQARYALYWGDLDTAGFIILNWARHHLPRLVSVLMDTPVLEAFAHLANPLTTDQRVEDLSRLTPAERACHDALNPPHGPRQQLEQERLPADHVREAITTAVTDH